MQTLLNSENIAIFVGLNFEYVENGLNFDNGVNYQYNQSNTSVIDQQVPYPQLSNVWKWENDAWVCVDQEAVDSYLAYQKNQFNAEQKEKRLKAYEKESDPIFFKWQREEATQQEWLDAVAKVPLQFPYQE
jgi:hypothetical protein